MNKIDSIRGRRSTVLLPGSSKQMKRVSLIGGKLSKEGSTSALQTFNNNLQNSPTLFKSQSPNKNLAFQKPSNQLTNLQNDIANKQSSFLRRQPTTLVVGSPKKSLQQLRTGTSFKFENENSQSINKRTGYGLNYDSFEEFIKTLGCADIKGMVLKFRAFSGYYGQDTLAKERANLHEFFRIADKDGNGDISFEEFKYFASQIILIEGIQNASEDQMFELFQKIDVDEDECVSFQEMFQYWCSCCREKLGFVEEEAKNRGIDV
eukprot:403376633